MQNNNTQQVSKEEMALELISEYVMYDGNEHDHDKEECYKNIAIIRQYINQ